MAEGAIDRGQRRPFGLVLLIVLWLVYAILPILYLLEVPRLEPAGIVRLIDAREANLVGNGLLAAIALSTAIGLWLDRSWAYVLAMFMIGVSLAIDIWAYLEGDPAYVYLALGVIITFYLNQASLRRRFMDTGVSKGAVGSQ